MVVWLGVTLLQMAAKYDRFSLYRKFYKILRIQIPLINVEEFRYKQEAVKFGYDIQFIKNSRAKWRKEQFVFDNLRTGTQTFLLLRYEMDHESID